MTLETFSLRVVFGSNGTPPDKANVRPRGRQRWCAGTASRSPHSVPPC